MLLYSRRSTVLGCVACLAASGALAAALLGVWGRGLAQAETTPKAKAVEDPALDRAREQVQMLDDLYKNAVVSITKLYPAKGSAPAIMVAKDVFEAMRKKGHHSARLVDATGDPFNEENSPATDFEKAAYKEIRAGKPYYERIVGEGKERRLLAATVVPVVMKRCAECHTGKKLGDVLGFLRYDLPVR